MTVKKLIQELQKCPEDNGWADKNGVAKVPNALVAFLEINGLLNTEKTVKWCRARRQEKQTEESE